MFLTATHTGTGLVTAGTIFEIDRATGFVVENLSIRWQFVLGNRFLTPLFASSKQFIDVLSSLPKSLIILFREPVSEVVWKRGRGTQWHCTLALCNFGQERT
jgi:hypothetical protein